MAGFVGMISVLVVVGVEMFFATKGAGHVDGGHTPKFEEEGATLLTDNVAASGSLKVGRRPGSRHFRDQSSLFNESHQDTQQMARPPTPSDAGTDDLPSSPDSSRDSIDNLDPQKPHGNGHMNGHGNDFPSSSAQPFGNQQVTDPATIKRMILQCMLLEAGILFHSVFIGMAVSVATGPPFVVLLIAISFHQTFEGLALGSRIAAIPSFSVDSPRPWLMALAYGTTTPIGQAIGLIVHNLYDPASEGGLIMVGIMNAISSGLLLFAGLVELLAEDFLKEESYHTLKGKKRLEACGAVVAGALLMALVGAWA
ncbi:MAG: hypothetical protein Q9159_000022 [Coniocarpon cinnabarinum]